MEQMDLTVRKQCWVVGLPPLPAMAVSHHKRGQSSPPLSRAPLVQDTRENRMESLQCDLQAFAFLEGLRHTPILQDLGADTESRRAFPRVLRQRQWPVASYIAACSVGAWLGRPESLLIPLLNAAGSFPAGRGKQDFMLYHFILVYLRGLQIVFGK